MSNYFKIFITCATLSCATIAWAAAATPWTLPQQTAAIPGVSAEVSVNPNAMGTDYIVRAVFSTSGRSLHAACLSAYRDLRYVLHDATGHLVAVDQNAIKHPPADESTDYYSVSTAPAGAATTCEKSADRQAIRIARLGALYPHVAAGTYTLQLYLAPRGVTDSAAFAPIQVIVDAQHKI